MLAAHFPVYQLDGAHELPLGNGRLVHLLVDEWRGLDSAYHFQDFRYERTRPLFYVVDDDLPGVDAAGFLSGVATEVHLALSIRDASCGRTPGPQLSMGYHRRSDGSTEIVSGPLGHEGVIWGTTLDTPIPALNHDDIRRASTALRWLQEARGDDMVGVLGTAIELTSRPDIGELVAFTVSVSAIEYALMAEVRESLRVTFGRRVATLLETDHPALAERAEMYGDLYRLRSDLVHGAARASTLERFGLESTDQLGAGFVRDLMRAVLVRGLSVRRSGVDTSVIGDLLDAAFDDADARRSLATRIADGASDE